MNILNILNYSTEFGGGILKHLSALGKLCAERGDRLFLAFPQERSWQKELISTAEVIVFPEILNPLRSGFPTKLGKICTSNSIDILHIHFTFAQAFSLALKLTNWKIPTVYHWHNPPRALNTFLTPENNLIGIFKRYISGYIARITDRRVIDLHISMSKEITLLLLKNKWTTENKIKLIQNGVSPVSSRSLKKTKNSELKIIGTVANFRPQKDHKTLIMAFKKLIKSGAHCELWIIGDGPTRPGIEKLAADLGIQSSVRFLGTVLDTSEFYKKFDVFVLSTHFEGHSLVALEAMSFGLPIVATRVSSIPEVITDNVNGLLFNPGDSVQLARSIKMLLDDDDLYNRISESSLNGIKTLPTTEDWATNVLSSYEYVLKLKDK